MKLLFEALLTFVSTSIDDIFVLLVMFGMAKETDKYKIYLGQSIGIFMVGLISLAVAGTIQFFFADYLKYLGFIPIIIGLIYLFKKEEEDNNISIGLMTIILLVLSESGDNVAVYVSLFANKVLWESLLITAVLVLCAFGWCSLVEKISNNAVIKKVLAKSGKYLVTVTLCLVGLLIIFD